MGLKENSENKYLFQVNLKGMIELLSEHIYSAPNVFVRELLQNGIDEATSRRTIDEAHRGICGLSMGGFHSLYISARYPDKFDYIGLFSAAIDRQNAGENTDVYENLEQKLEVQFANPPKLYWIGIGSFDFLYDSNVNFRKRLDQKGYTYTYVETEGGHIWRNWRVYLTQFAPLLFQ